MEGQLQLVPARPDQDMVAEASSFGIAPWNVLTFLGMRGSAVATGEDLVVVSLEWPRPHAGAAGLDQRSLERSHVDQFSTDYLLATGRLPYDAIESGTEERPDFVAVEDGQTVGLECAQYTVQRRRHAAGLFEDLRDAAILEPRRNFSHLRGRFVFMWFHGGDERPALPPIARRTDAVEAIIEALGEEIPAAPTAEVEPAEAPPEFPAVEVAIRTIQLPRTDFRCGFYSVSMRGAAPSSSFFAQTGFEMGLSYQTTHTRPEAHAELLRLISEHDQSGVDHLLISAGAPNKAGLTFVSDLYVLDFLLRGSEIALPSPSHIQRIMLHFWGFGRIIEIFPQERRINADIYAGYVPPHFPAAARAVETEAGEPTSPA